MLQQRRRDSRSQEAAAWRNLTKSRRWQQARAAFLEEHPLCERCTEAGRVTAATVVHHRIAHKGDLDLFWDRANWQSLCFPHHDIDAQSEERTGFSKSIGADGWPVDPMHVVNR